MSDASHSDQAKRSRSHSISFLGNHTQPADSPATTQRTNQPSILSLLRPAQLDPLPVTAKNMSFSPASSTTSSSDEELRTPPSASPKLTQLPKISDEQDETDLNAWKHTGSGRRSTWTGDMSTSPIASWLKGLPSPPAPGLEGAGEPNNSLGLFRRFSLSNSKPIIKPPHSSGQRSASVSVPEHVIEDTDDNRLGRGLSRSTSSKRRLSPMASRMLTGQFYA